MGLTNGVSVSPNRGMGSSSGSGSGNSNRFLGGPPGPPGEPGGTLGGVPVPPPGNPVDDPLPCPDDPLNEPGDPVGEPDGDPVEELPGIGSLSGLLSVASGEPPLESVASVGGFAVVADENPPAVGGAGATGSPSGLVRVPRRSRREISTAVIGSPSSLSAPRLPVGAGLSASTERPLRRYTSSVATSPSGRFTASCDCRWNSEPGGNSASSSLVRSPVGRTYAVPSVASPSKNCAPAVSGSGTRWPPISSAKARAAPPPAPKRA